MSKYAKIVNNKVVQVCDYKVEGFVIVPDDVVPYMYLIDGTFITLNEFEFIEDGNIKTNNVKKQSIEDENRIVELKQYLIETDYKSLKAFEGNPGEDWETVKASRQSARDEINSLENTYET